MNLLHIPLTGGSETWLWITCIAGPIVSIALTWILVRWWYVRLLRKFEERYLATQAKYEHMQETYKSLAYNNAALRSDRNRWEEEQAELHETHKSFLERISLLEKKIAELTPEEA